jgi:hypothetical protein
LTLFAASCASPRSPPASYVARYNYVPSRTGGGDGISIGLLAPAYSREQAAAIAAARGGESPFSKGMREALGRGLIEYFTRAGFTVSGPYNSAEEMTFPEKKQADLLLSIEIGLDVQWPAVLPRSRYTFFSFLFGGMEKLAETKGPCTLIGTIGYVLWEPLSMQRMWSKQLQAPPSSVDCTAKEGWPEEVYGSLGNQANRLYELAFPQIMKTAERYFDPDEVSLVKRQSQELREKKVYQ